MSGTKRKVSELRDEGLIQADIARQLGLSASTVSYHVRRLGFPRGLSHRRYDWSAVQRFYDSGHSGRQCEAKFGFAHKTWTDAVKRGAIVARPRAMPVDELISRRRNRTHLKGRLIREGLLETRCARCGISRWRGAPLSLALHHLNGDRHDNRLENLALLCPNCHSQTENFAGRNVPRRHLRSA